MTDEVSTESIADSALAATISEPKLYAGKYKTVEELEEGYRNSAKVYNENKELSTKLEQVTKIPDEYALPQGITLRESEIQEIKAIAKESGLSQQHFDKLALQMANRLKANVENLERAKKEVGDEKLTLLQDHVKKNYPEKIQQIIINQAIKDKDIREAIMSERDTKLNSQVPGMDKSGASHSTQYDGHSEMVKAAQDYQRNPTQKNRERYIKMAGEVGRAKLEK